MLFAFMLLIFRCFVQFNKKNSSITRSNIHIGSRIIASVGVTELIPFLTNLITFNRYDGSNGVACSGSEYTPMQADWY